MGSAHARRNDAEFAKRRRRLTLLVCAAVVVAALTVTAGVVIGRLQNNITAVELPGSSTPPAGESPEPAPALNILLLGSDGRDAGDGAYGHDDGTMRSDAMVLVHLGAHNAFVDAVQIPRDTVLQLPGCDDSGRGAFAGGQGMINSALNYGAPCSVAAVEQLTGVTIDHFIEMNFDGFAAIVDAVGGIEVCLPEALVDPRADLDLPAGTQTVGGEQALALARTRHAVGDGSDIARMGHQQTVMSAIAQRATSTEVLARPGRLYVFLDAVTSSITVDSRLGSLPELAALATRLAKVNTADITFMTMPWEEAPTNRNRVVPAAEAEQIFAAIAHDEPAASGTAPEPPSDGADSRTDDSTEDAPPSDPVQTRSADTPLCEQP